MFFCNIQCNTPYYAGNGVLCAQDSDQDGRPDIQLQCVDPSCQMACIFSWNDAFILHYAFLQDVCPYVFNPEEDSLVCEPIGTVISLVM